MLPDLKRLGPRLGKRLPALKAALAKADARRTVGTAGSATSRSTLDLPDGPVTLDGEDLQVRLQAKPGWAAAQGRSGVVVLSTELTPALILEGHAREVVHAIQTQRRDEKCEYTDRIDIFLETDSADLKSAVEQFHEYVCAETLAISINEIIPPGVEAIELVTGEHHAKLFVRVARG